MDILRELIFTIPLDMRALCREIATAGLSKGRARSGVPSALTNPAEKPKKVCLQYFNLPAPAVIRRLIAPGFYIQKQHSVFMLPSKSHAISDLTQNVLPGLPFTSTMGIGCVYLEGSALPYYLATHRNGHACAQRPAVRAPEAGQDDISADVAGDIRHRNTPDSVPRKRRLAGPSPSQVCVLPLLN